MSDPTGEGPAPLFEDFKESMPALGHWVQQRAKWVKSEQEKKDNWLKIGSEVYARKTLLLAAAAALEANHVPHPLRLAATDVLVEKAQLQLTERATLMNRWGVFLYATAILSLAASALLLAKQGAVLPKPADVSGYVLTLAIVKTSTSGALAFAGIYFMIALAKALFREGALLLNRRHALRYLRLCVYLTDGEIKLEQLKEMFNWNADFATAFQDIDDKAMGAPLNKAFEFLSVTTKNLSEIAARATSKATS